MNVLAREIQFETKMRLQDSELVWTPLSISLWKPQICQACNIMMMTQSAEGQHCLLAYAAKQYVLLRPA